MPGLIRLSISWLFGYREVPLSSRAIFRHEFRHMLFWGVVWGSLNGGFCGYIALSRFGASDLLVSIIAAAMAFANLFAVWWAELATRLPKKRLMTASLTLVSLLLWSVLLTPSCDALWTADQPRWVTTLIASVNPLSAMVFTAQIVCLWVAVQGANTFRTSIWRYNYPDLFRGRILARFAIWQMLIGTSWVAATGAYLDGRFALEIGSWRMALDLRWMGGAGDDSAYSRIFAIAGIAGVLALLCYRHVKVRVRSDQRPAPLDLSDRSGTAALEPSYATPGWFATRFGALHTGVAQALRTLAADAAFRRYMAWMFLSGSAVMMIHVPLVIIFKQVFAISYLQAAGLLTVVPQVVVVVLTPLWARLFDRWSLYYFRAIQIGLWAVSRFLLAYGVYRTSLPWVVAATAFSGAALAGGGFAWQLGHMSFSKPSNDSTYLGIHQTLTGFRGLTMPFLGAILYRHVCGWHLIWISGVLLVISVGGYWRMHREADR